MAAKKIIAITGATGNQGGALLRAILGDGAKSEFLARAITRDVKSDKAQNLKRLGAELAQADTYNEAALTEAIKGCYGLYCVSALNFADPDSEKKQAKTMADAAKKAGIKHVIWSTLEDTRNFIPLESTTMPTLMGKYKVPHFDGKGESDQYFADLPTTYMLTSFYWENFMSYFPPRKGPDGKLYITLPMGKRTMPGISTDDIGKCALGIFKRPDLINKRIAIAGETLTIADMAAKMSKALGQEIFYNEVSFDAFRHFGFPGAEDLGNMFQFYHDCEKEFAGARNVDETRKLNPELMSFDQWLAKNKGQIAIQ